MSRRWRLGSLRKWRTPLVMLWLGVTLVVAAWWFAPVPPPPPAGGIGALQLRPDHASRIVVFAPHCDDETLGAGGLIQQALARGARVRVVLLTNGDGFTLAVERQYRILWAHPSDYLRLAHLRQAETLAALHKLGLRPEQVTFLGYPDRGLLPIWQWHWFSDRPYRSRYTRDVASPYRNSLTPHAPYAAEAVVADLMQILSQERPTAVLIPHPNDAHPDHCATYAMVMFALSRLQALSLAVEPPPALYTYLVHRGHTYPYPTGYRPTRPLLPPSTLGAVGTRWLELPLTPRQVRRKYEATQCYRTQVRLMGPYLVSFCRANELFGVLREHVLPLAEPVGQGGLTILTDPARDTVLRNVQGGGDLVRISASCTQAALWLQVTARSRIKGAFVFRVWLHTVPEGSPMCCQVTPGQPPRWSFPGWRRPPLPEGADAVFHGNELLLRVPLSLLGDSGAVLVAAETRRLNFLVDRTGTALAYLPWGSPRLPGPTWAARREPVPAGPRLPLARPAVAGSTNPAKDFPSLPENTTGISVPGSD